ncbi:MAG: AAA family ATPase [Planctomycetota bacterium]|nr:MAG: AAA family ATPase [Planctomycetota bacterium]
MTQPSDIEQVHAATRDIAAQLSRVIVGQQTVVEELLTCVLAGGHCLLVGVPGLAKTLMVRSLADCLGLSFNRVQFTPDLMPADVTGTEVIQEDRSTGQRELRFIPGPVFANVILADEINRTPPKTQAALLEAMQEHQVTVGGVRHPLPEPFFVLATQNPIEQEGTYPLPEAQLDRFMFEVRIDYPDEDEEFQIVRQTTSTPTAKILPLLTHARLQQMQATVRDIPVADSVIRFALLLSRLSRSNNPQAPDFVKQYITWGAGPRASQHLILAAKARAALHGRMHVDIHDVITVAKPVMRHRIVTNFHAEADHQTPDTIVEKLIEHARRLANQPSAAERATKVLADS